MAPTASSATAHIAGDSGGKRRAMSKKRSPGAPQSASSAASGAARQHKRMVIMAWNGIGMASCNEGGQRKKKDLADFWAIKRKYQNEHEMNNISRTGGVASA